jgi:hypothetical protein
LNGIRILFPSVFGPLAAQSQPEEHLLQFFPGEIIRGRVLEQIDPQLAVMRLNGKNLFVETHIPLPPQKDLIFQVEENDPKIILKPISANNHQVPAMAIYLKKLLAADVPTGTLAEKIASLGQMEADDQFQKVQGTLQKFLGLLQRFTLAEPYSKEADPWQPILAPLGLFWENKIKHLIEGQKEDLFGLKVQEDIKGLALKLRFELKNLSLPWSRNDENFLKAEEWIRGLDQFLGKIELYQILNLRQANPQEKIFLLLPFWFGHRPQFVELNLTLPQRQSTRPDAEEVTVLFLLDLPELGRLRIEVKIRGKELFCLFMTHDSQKAKFIRQPFPSLASRLEKLGFRSHIDVWEESIEKVKSTLVREIEKSSESLLNLKV